MASKKTKRKATSPAESIRPAPSRPVSPVYQAASRCDTPNQGYFDPQHSQEHLDNDSSSELEYHQEENDPNSPKAILLRASEILQTNEEIRALLLPSYAELILELVTKHHPFISKKILANNKAHKELTAQAVAAALVAATPPPPPPPIMEVDPPTTPTGPKPPGATPRPRGNLTPPAAPVPQGKPALPRTPPTKRAPKCAAPPPPTQEAPKPSYAAALGSKAPRPRKAHPPTMLVAPETAKWVIIPKYKSLLRSMPKLPSSHSIVSAINEEFRSAKNEIVEGTVIADLGPSPILAANWTVGCNILITAVKTREEYGFDTLAYGLVLKGALYKIPNFSTTVTAIIPYRPASRLQIKGLPTWDPATNKPVKLTSVYQTLDDLGIFKGVELIKNGPAPSDALSWARDPKTFNAESRPCAVTVRFYNNNGRETGALLKKAFYLLGCRRRFDKWPARPPPPKKGQSPQAARPQAGHT
ncbi:hypothetical protein H0H81_008938 [Sphagnurus paluster]|uniref:Uncharacterized protein n=1 Tax=Sphagnurus paluster TaxID=117069 RepID=A0A9P7FQ76_9AGAR|nr:hypothetical protein H0H81_008938 [Sphagnurus paluster]